MRDINVKIVGPVGQFASALQSPITIDGTDQFGKWISETAYYERRPTLWELLALWWRTGHKLRK